MIAILSRADSHGLFEAESVDKCLDEQEDDRLPDHEIPHKLQHLAVPHILLEPPAITMKKRKETMMKRQARNDGKYNHLLALICFILVLRRLYLVDPMHSSNIHQQQWRNAAFYTHNYSD